jgi:hypothetical protein
VVEPRHTPKPAGRASLVGACAFAILLTAGYEVEKHRDARPADDLSTAVVSIRTPEAQLAAIQLNHGTFPRKRTVKRIAELLDLLEADCPADTRSDLEQLTIRSLGELRLSGIAATPTQILGGVVGLDDIGALPHCSPFFERYVRISRREGEASR